MGLCVCMCMCMCMYDDLNNNEHVQSYCTQLQTLFKQLVNVHCRLCVLATLCTWVAAEREGERLEQND